MTPPTHPIPPRHQDETKPEDSTGRCSNQSPRKPTSTPMPLTMRTSPTTPRMEESKINKGLRRQKKIKRSRERVWKKKRKKTPVIKSQMVSKMKNNPGWIRIFQVKNQDKEGKISNSADLQGILLGRVKYHTSVNKQTGSAHNLNDPTLIQD